MAINKLLGFRNNDSTADLNARLAGLVPKGIVSGGVVHAEPNTLQVRVTGDGVNPWTFLVYSPEGMLVRGTEDVVLPVIAGTTNVICVRAKYVEGGEATGEVLSMTKGAFEIDPDPKSLIRLCAVTPDVGATAVQPTDIDFTFRDSVEGFRRNPLRGVVDTVADLPASSGFPAVGEINFISNSFADGTSITVATDAVSVTFPIVDPIEFNLAAPTSDPLTAGLSRINPSEKTISATSEAALTGVVTVYSTLHNLPLGAQVRITGTTQPSHNGLWTIASVAVNSFTFVKSGSLTAVSSTGGVVINTSTVCTVTAHLAPGVLHNLLPGNVITIEDAIDPSFNVASTVAAVFDAQTFTFTMVGYQTANSGGGRVVRVGVSIPPNGVQIGTSATLTASNFERVFRASSLASSIHATAIGSSVSLQALLLGTVGNSYTLAENDPDDAIVLSGSVFEGGADPTLTDGVLELRIGDVYVVIYGESGSLELWGYDGILFRNLTSASVDAQLDFHRRNIYPNEKHLTENLVDALEGSVGVPSSLNKFVTQEDVSVLTVDLGDALQGADNVAPSNSNRFLTEARYRGQRSDIVVPTGMDWVQLTSGDRWVVGNDSTAASIGQYFNVVHTDTLQDPGGPTEYTQKDFTPVTVSAFYTDSGLSIPLDPSNLATGADDKGIYPRVEAFTLGYPVDLYVMLSAVPDNGDCSVVYSKAVKEKFRSTTADMLATPQRIMPAKIASIDNKVAELRFNDGIGVSGGKTVSFPANLFVSSNLQEYTMRRMLGGRGVALEDGFSINFETTAVTGSVEAFSPVDLATGKWTRYLLSLDVDGLVRVHPLSKYLQYASDLAVADTASELGVVSNAFSHGEWLFASVAVQSSGPLVIEDIESSSIELYPYQDSRDPYAPITVGDSLTSFGHYSGPDAITRALAVATKGDVIRILPGDYLGQALVTTDGVTLEWSEGATLSFKTRTLDIPNIDWSSGTDNISYTAHGFLHNQQVRFTTNGTIPTSTPQINTSTTYYIHYVDANTFKLSTSQNGPTIDLSTAGSGTHTLSTHVIKTANTAWTVLGSIINYTGHGFYDNLAVKVTSTTTLPTGISSAATYYVDYVSANQFKLLDAPNGAVVSFSNQGAGIHTIAAEQIGLIVDAADVTVRDAHFDRLDIAGRLTANATGFSAKGITYGDDIVEKNFDSAGTVTKTSLVANLYSLTCTDGISTRYFGDYNSVDAIQDALDAASDGDTIIIYPGTYNSITVIKDNLHIIGQAGVFIDGGVTNPCISVSGSGNIFEGIVCTNSTVGIDCLAGATDNVFDATVVFAGDIKTRMKFPDTTGPGVKHNNYHPAISGRGSHLVIGDNHGDKWVTVGDGIDSWGDYTGSGALKQALQLEESGTTIYVGNGVYSAVTGVAFDNMTVVGTGQECVVEATQGTDDICFEIAGDHNKVSGLHCRVYRAALPHDYSIIGIKAAGNGNIIDRISFDETGATLVAPHVRYVQPDGVKSVMRSRTGAATAEVTFTVGDGVRSFGDFVGTLSGFASALNALPQLPGGIEGDIGAGTTVSFQDTSAFPIDFSSPTSTYYVGSYITISSGPLANQGSWKITSVTDAITVTITRTDGSAFVADTGVTWSMAVGTKIVMLPGTYDPITIPLTKNDVVVEAWEDVVIAGGVPLITVEGSRCRVSGFRLEPTGAGTTIQVSGHGNTFERNRFSSTVTAKYTISGSGNRVYDAAENSDKTCYTVSPYPSRADFVGSDEVAIQAAVDAADNDQHIKRVFIGAGTYTLTGTVNIPAGISVFGGGYDTHLVGDGSFAAFTLAGSNSISGVRFDNFSYSLTGPATKVIASGNWFETAPVNGNITSSLTSYNL